jgi:hypothetical protein
VTFLHHCRGVYSLLHAAHSAERSTDVTQDQPNPALCAFTMYADKTTRPTVVCIRQYLLNPSTWHSLLANYSEGDGLVRPRGCICRGKDARGGLVVS